MTFLLLQEYIDVFEPLMLTECTSLLRRGKVEAEEIPETNKCVMGPASQVCCLFWTSPHFKMLS